jgi:hypothetical protein
LGGVPAGASAGQYETLAANDLRGAALDRLALS